MTQLDVGLHHVTTQIDVAIFQPCLFVRQGSVAGQKWRQLRCVQHAQLFHHQFHFTRGNILVDRVGVAQLDGANGRDDELVPQRASFFMRGSVGLFVEDDLENSRTIAEVNKQQVAKIAPTVHPPHQHSFFASIGGTQFAAHMSSPKIAEKIEHSILLLSYVLSALEKVATESWKTMILAGGRRKR